MTEPQIVENTEDDDVNLDRWQKYGKDRLYLNGTKSDDFYADLDGSEGHGAAGKKSVEVDGDRVIFKWKTGWDGNWTTHRVIVDLNPDTDDEDALSEVPPEVPYNAKNAGKAQQITAKNMAARGV